MRFMRPANPRNIAGIVFVDPSTPGQFDAFLPEARHSISRICPAREGRNGSRIRLTRLLGKCGAFLLDLMRGQVADGQRQRLRPALYTTQEREMAAFELSGKEAASRGPWATFQP